MTKNKKIYFLSMLFLTFICSISAVDTDLKKADALYRKGNFADAIPLYRILRDKNPQNPYYHYNLANCHYKMGRRGRAVISFYRAFDILPRDGNIRENLASALAAGGENLVPQGVPVILHKLYFYFSFAELKGMFWFFFWVFSVFTAVYFIFGVRGKIFKISIYFLTGFVLFSGLWAGIRSFSMPDNKAVIIKTSAAIRSGPAESFDIIAYIGDGKIVFITGQKDSWYEIYIKKQALKGWVDKNSLEMISNVI